MGQSKKGSAKQDCDERSSGSQSDTRVDSARQRPAPAAEPARITPLKERIGEGPGNLGRREEWFRRRSGGTG